MAFLRSSFALIWFCCLTLGAMPAHCAAETPPGPAESDPGHAWLLRARAALAGHQSISANIHQRIHLYGQELVAAGVFVQGPPAKNLLYLDLKLKIGGQDSYRQQRCDGKFYWLQRFEDGIPKLTRVDLKRVEAARAANAGLKAAGPANLQPVAAKDGPPMLGLGGMAFLLDELADWCVFPKVEQRRLPTREATPVIVLEGGWQRERLLLWLPDQAEGASQGKPIDLSKLPPMLPDRIVVFLGRDDLFPRRIEYSVSGSRDLPRDEPEPLLQVHFDEVRFDVEVPPSKFTFEGGVVAPIDDTDGYLLRAGFILPAAQ
jgi:outer membrane lipoprotein-sorting protein